MPAYLGYDDLGAFTLGSTNMTPTTLRTVAADFVSTIEGIDPDYDLEQESEWASVDKLDDVPGENLRLFFCVWEPSRPIEADGIYGAGVEHESFCRVFTNYRTLDEVTAYEMIDSDGDQLWITLQERVDPVLDGLTAVYHEGYEPEEDEDGHQWGAHVFRVLFLKSHQA